MQVVCKKVFRSLWAYVGILLHPPDMVLVSVCKPFNEYYDVPYNVSSVFTGREDICHRLRECCLPSGPQSTQKEQKRFALFGGGGFGKTQVCLKFAQDQREK